MSSKAIKRKEERQDPLLSHSTPASNSHTYSTIWSWIHTVSLSLCRSWSRSLPFRWCYLFVFAQFFLLVLLFLRLFTIGFVNSLFADLPQVYCRLYTNPTKANCNNAVNGWERKNKTSGMEIFMVFIEIYGERGRESSKKRIGESKKMSIARWRKGEEINV